MKRSTILCLLAFIVGGTHSLAMDAKHIPVFATEEQILAVSRQDQSSAIRTKSVNREVFLTEVIQMLTTYRKVTKHQYMTYAHQIGISGTVTLTNGKVYTWSIEPGYAATVKSLDGEEIYLLRPELKTEPAPPAGRGEAPRP